MMNADNIATIVLGDEYDSELRARVIGHLKNLGATFSDKIWGVGGSQEVNILELTLSGKPIVLEAETFIGLTIQGDRDLIGPIADQIKG